MLVARNMRAELFFGPGKIKTMGKHVWDKPGPGRPKGLQNKVTRDLKDMILGALDAAGGQAYLQRQAEENPKVFCTLVGKVLPLQVNQNLDGKLEITWQGS